MEESLNHLRERIQDDNSLLMMAMEKLCPGLPGFPAVAKRMMAVKDAEAFGDCLAEVRFALLFLALGFDVEFEPLGRKGPDLRVRRDGMSVLVEIKRFRPAYPGPQMLQDSSKEMGLLAYGNPERDVRIALSSLIGKFPQVGEHQAIIAVWNDDGDMEDQEMRSAATSSTADSAAGTINLPNGLQFVMYGSVWVQPETPRQIHCFPMKPALEQPFHRWCEELEESVVSDLLSRVLKNPINDC